MIYERCSECRAWNTQQNYCRASAGIVSGEAGKPVCETLTGNGFTRLPGGIANGVYLPQAGDPAVVAGLYPAGLDHSRKVVTYMDFTPTAGCSK